MIAKSTLDLAVISLNTLSDQLYDANLKAGWYHDPVTRRKIKRDPMVMLMLIVTEVAEAAEGWRKTKMDDHLPHRTMFEVEMADVLVRIFDLIGYVRANPDRFPAYKEIDLGRAFCEKVLYNGTRADHKLENRAQPGGKAC